MQCWLGPDVHAQSTKELWRGWREGERLRQPMRRRKERERGGGREARGGGGDGCIYYVSMATESITHVDREFIVDTMWEVFNTIDRQKLEISEGFNVGIAAATLHLHLSDVIQKSLLNIGSGDLEVTEIAPLYPNLLSRQWNITPFSGNN